MPKNHKAGNDERYRDADHYEYWGALDGVVVQSLSQVVMPGQIEAPDRGLRESRNTEVGHGEKQPDG